MDRQIDKINKLQFSKFDFINDCSLQVGNDGQKLNRIKLYENRDYHTNMIWDHNKKQPEIFQKGRNKNRLRVTNNLKITSDANKKMLSETNLLKCPETIVYVCGNVRLVSQLQSMTAHNLCFLFLLPAP